MFSELYGVTPWHFEQECSAFWFDWIKTYHNEKAKHAEAEAKKLKRKRG